MDLEKLREYVALGGSMLALASTGYFWFVRANRERMQLSIYPAGSLRGSVLANEDFDTLRRVSPNTGQVCAKYFLDLAIVNNSTLPNAVLGVRVKIQMADGSVRTMDTQPADPQEVLVPANLRPLSTAHFRLAVSTAIDGSLTGGFAERESQAADALQYHPEVTVELMALGEKKFSRTFRDDGQKLNRTPAATDQKAA